MCESFIKIGEKKFDGFELSKKPYQIIHEADGIKRILLDSVEMIGEVNFSAVHKVKNCYGVSDGYMIIIGKKAQ